MKEGIIQIRERGIWWEKEFFGTIIGGIVLIDSIYTFVSEKKKSAMLIDSSIIFILVSLAIFVVFLFANIKINRRKNWLLLNGEIVFAKIVKSWLTDDAAYVKCTYLKNETIWQYEAKIWCLGLGSGQKFDEETLIPVIVCPQNYGEYIILLREMIWSYGKGINRPMHFTKVIREVN